MSPTSALPLSLPVTLMLNLFHKFRDGVGLYIISMSVARMS